MAVKARLSKKAPSFATDDSPHTQINVANHHVVVPRTYFHGYSFVIDTWCLTTGIPVLRSSDNLATIHYHIAFLTTPAFSPAVGP